MGRIYIITSTLIITFFGNVFAQEPIEVDLTHPDLVLLEAQILHAVNDLRVQKKLSLHKRDDVLYRAAKDHADFLITEQKLQHEQRIKEKRTPFNRVKIHGGLNFSRVGENLASARLGVVVNLKGRKLSTQSYNSAAAAIAQIWKASPKHYRNILHKGFNTTAVATAYDINSQRLIAVQVFGFTNEQMKGGEQPDYSQTLLAMAERKLPFRLKENEALRKKDSKTIKAFLQLTSLNGMLVGSYKAGKKAFKGRRSGLVVESVPLAQFDSGAHEYNLVRNRRNALFPLNGELDEPVYRRAMLRFSRQLSPRRVLLNLRVLRIYKREKKFYYPTNGGAGTNVFLIRKRRLITYITPLALPVQLFNEPMPALKFESGFSNLPLKEKFRQVIKYDTLELKVFYASGSMTIDPLAMQNIIETVRNIRGRIISINASAYASIDGDMSANQDLAQRRMQVFLSVVKPYLDSTGVAPHVESKEQWDLFQEQIKKNNLSHLRKLPKRELRNYVNAHKTDSLISSLLAKQRFTLFRMVIKNDSLIPLPVEKIVDNYYHQKEKFELLRKKNVSQAGILELAQLKAYSEIISKHLVDTIAIVNSERYPAFQYHDLMFNYLFRGTITDEDFYQRLHSLGQSKYLSSQLRKRLVHNNLVFLYRKYGTNELWSRLDKDQLYCNLYRKSQFLVRYKKKLRCWRNERLFSNAYYVLKEFPYLISTSQHNNSSLADSLSRFYTMAMIHALYEPILPKEIEMHVAKVKPLYHPNDNTLSLEERVKLAFFYCAFYRLDVANSLLAPVADNPQLSPDGQKLFITLQADAFDDEHEFANYLIKQYQRLGEYEWCSLWTEGKYLNHVLLEDQKLKRFYNCNCQSKDCKTE